MVGNWFAGAVMLGILGVSSALWIRPKSTVTSVVYTTFIAIFVFGYAAAASPVSSKDFGLAVATVGGVLLAGHGFVYSTAIRYHGGTRFPPLVTYICVLSSVVIGAITYMALLHRGEWTAYSVLGRDAQYRLGVPGSEGVTSPIPFLDLVTSCTVPVFVGAIAFLGAPMSAVVRSVLHQCGLTEPDTLDQEATIGAFERWLTFFFFINSWFAPILILIVGRGYLVLRDPMGGPGNRVALLLLASFGLALVVGTAYAWLPWTEAIQYVPVRPRDAVY